MKYKDLTTPSACHTLKEVFMEMTALEIQMNVTTNCMAFICQQIKTSIKQEWASI